MKHKVKHIHFVDLKESNSWRSCLGRGSGYADWQSHEA
jgi:hypothetical protein